LPFVYKLKQQQDERGHKNDAHCVVIALKAVCTYHKEQQDRYTLYAAYAAKASPPAAVSTSRARRKKRFTPQTAALVVFMQQI
jgi:hypothetical protein